MTCREHIHRSLKVQSDLTKLTILEERTEIEPQETISLITKIINDGFDQVPVHLNLMHY